MLACGIKVVGDCQYVHRDANESGTIGRGVQRLSAVGAYARAVRNGDPKSLARVAIALASPRFGVRLARRRLDAAWASEADAWLAPFRDNHVVC